MNNYQTLFQTYHKAPRYAKHHFNRHANVSMGVAKGFIEGYSNGNAQTKQILLAEQFLQLFSLAYTQYNALQHEIDKEKAIRMGDREAIKERLLFKRIRDVFD